MHTRRSLKKNELREAIAFTIEDKVWDKSKMPNDLHRLIRACGNLVVVDEETDVVQFAHYTVQQYLLDLESSKSSKVHSALERSGPRDWGDLRCLSIICRLRNSSYSVFGYQYFESGSSREGRSYATSIAGRFFGSQSREGHHYASQQEVCSYEHQFQLSYSEADE